MSVLVANRLFALLALAALALGLGLAVAWLAPSWRRRMIGSFGEFGRLPLVLAWVIALVATLGSLYYSEVAGFEPCLLCWYQRIAMYPLALTAAVAAVRAERVASYYLVPPALVGLVIAVYHYGLQLFPDVGAGVCRLDNPCTLRYVEELGFVSIPFMAAAGFLSFVMLVVTWAAAHRKGEG